MKELKKAFTIVELVIVIAVIAILAAVLVPTFSNMILSAKVSNDNQTVAALNVALTAASSQGSVSSEEDLRKAVDDVYGSGFYDSMQPESASYGYHFWYNMQFQEIIGNHTVDLEQCALGAGMAVDGLSVHNGYDFIVAMFSNPVVVVLYLIWFVAIWFHLTHGFWSAIHTLGWNNDIWFNRWKTIAKVYATILCLGFAFVAIWFGFIY